MKKVFSFVFVLMFGCSLIALSPRNASAFGPVTPLPQTKAWEWYSEGVTGEFIPMESITTKPGAWYQLKSDGLKIDGPSGICYPFDEGRHGWTGVIFQRVGGDWVKLDTTVGWVPTEEGRYLACAQAPAAGMYALFAYFTKPAPKPVDCTAIWDEAYIEAVIFSGWLYFGGTINPDKFPHARVVMTIKDVMPAGTIDPLHYITYTNALGDFGFEPIWVDSAVLNMNLTLSGCLPPTK